MPKLNITIRTLEREDVREGTGFFETLGNLSPSPPIVLEHADRIFEESLRFGKTVFVAVSSETRQILGTTSFFAEPKFIRGGALAGHIEDVVTRKELEGNGIATLLMNAAIVALREKGCYKIILDCSDENVAFYEQFGFRPYETMMRLDCA